MNTQKTIRIRTVGFRLGVALGCSVAFLGASFSHAGVESIFEELVGHDANERELPFALSIPWLNPEAPDLPGGPLWAMWNGPDRPDAEDKPLDWSGIVLLPGDDLLGTPGSGIPGTDLWVPALPPPSLITPGPGIPAPGSHDLFTSTTPEWLDAGQTHGNSLTVPTSGGAIPGPATFALLALGGLARRQSRRRR